jgi:5,10-methenyltetrahydromethanopterin hydrogenase
MTNYKEQLEEAKTDLYNALIACRDAVTDSEFDAAQVAEAMAKEAYNALAIQLNERRATYWIRLWDIC